MFREKILRALSCVLSVVIAFSQSALLAGENGDQVEKRGVEVRDAIQMTRLGDSSYLRGDPSDGRVAHFSPDGKRFVVVVTKGDLERNTNLYSILLFETSSVFGSPKSDIVLTMSSSSNRPAVEHIKWLADNETLIFLGESPGEPAQVFTLNVKTKHLEKQTDHPTTIVAFDATQNGDEIIFEADPPKRKVVDTEQVRRDGIVVTNQLLNFLLAGDCQTYVPTFLEGEDVFVKQHGKSSVQIPLQDVVAGSAALSLSPDGRYALIEAFVKQVPKLWEGYEDRLTHEYATEQREKGAASILRRYLLFNVHENQLAPLLDTPADLYTSAFVWSPNGESVVLSGAYLPLDIPDTAERERRQKNSYVVEIRIADKNIVQITDKRLTVTSWLNTSNEILLNSRDSVNRANSQVYEKKEGRWKETVNLPPVPQEVNLSIEVRLIEDSNTPPKIYATDRQTRREALLFDLNPEFSKLRFGKVEDVAWTASDGHRVTGGLYFPLDFVPGKRYPLVIQTHGFDPHKFMIDGPWSSAFAAQPLAAQGFVVLQVEGSEDKKTVLKTIETPQEGPYVMAEYEGAIEYLNERGMIDPDRVGIIGFSRTVYSVEYTLTHSKYRFAAATVADGINAGYFAYLVFPTTSDELLNGGPPIGDTLVRWLKNSPGFNLDKVSTPVRLESYGLSGGILSEWEWFAGLSRLHKPVDLIYLPYATHILVKPWERMISQQGNVDWFCFWLNDHEDPSPTKAEQYKRWRELRKLQEQNEKKSANAASPTSN